VFPLLLSFSLFESHYLNILMYIDLRMFVNGSRQHKSNSRAEVTQGFWSSAHGELVISSAPHCAKTLPRPIRVSCFPSFGLARQPSDFKIDLFPPPPSPSTTPPNAAPFRLVSARMKVTYTSYTAVAEWKWDLPEEADDTCGICRVQFEGTCAKCKYPGQDCPIGIVLSRLQHVNLKC
jgi:hypothetical protein